MLFLDGNFLVLIFLFGKFCMKLIFLKTFVFSKGALCVFCLFFEKMSFGICLPPLMDLVFSNVIKVSLLFFVQVSLPYVFFPRILGGFFG